MLKIIKSLTFTFLFLGFIIQGIPQFSEIESSDHLEEYAQFNTYTHPSIDDDYHTHTHKHSEEGEEHDHSHEHGQVSSVEFKVVLDSYLLSPKLNIVESINSDGEKNLISSAYPQTLFRPPIA